MEFIRLSAKDYMQPKTLQYEDVFGLHELYDQIAFRANTILVGPKGIGKSLSVAAWGAQKDVPVVSFDCSEDARRSHLVGNFILRGEETPFVLGPLSTAYEIANEHGECILNLEEVNALTPQIQKLLNAASDFRNKLVVQEAEKVFKLDNDAKLWIVGTMNTAAYGGVYQLNEDLKSRFRMIPLDYPDDVQLRKVIFKQCGKGHNTEDVEGLITLAAETKQNAMNYHLSPRDIVQILEDSSYLGMEKAIWMASGKFDEDDRKTFIKRVRSTLGVKIPE